MLCALHIFLEESSHLHRDLQQEVAAMIAAPKDLIQQTQTFFENIFRGPNRGKKQKLLEFLRMVLNNHHLQMAQITPAWLDSFFKTAQSYENSNTTATLLNVFQTDEMQDRAKEAFRADYPRLLIGLLNAQGRSEHPDCVEQYWQSDIVSALNDKAFAWALMAHLSQTDYGVFVNATVLFKSLFETLDCLLVGRGDNQLPISLEVISGRVQVKFWKDLRLPIISSYDFVATAAYQVDISRQGDTVQVSAQAKLYTWNSELLRTVQLANVRQQATEKFSTPLASRIAAPAPPSSLLMSVTSLARRAFGAINLRSPSVLFGYPYVKTAASVHSTAHPAAASPAEDDRSRGEKRVSADVSAADDSNSATDESGLIRKAKATVVSRALFSSPP